MRERFCRQSVVRHRSEPPGEIQFDPKFHGRISENGRRQDDDDDIRVLFGATEGVQIKKVRRPRKRPPAWVFNVRKLRKRIFRPALRRYRIAYLYWHVGLNAREIAETMKMKKKNVEAVIHKIVSGSEPT